MEMKNVILVVITILFAVSLIGTVADEVVSAQSGNVTGASSVILGLTTLIFGAGIVMFAYKGMIGGSN